MSQTARGIKAALVGLLINIVLVIVKLLAGIAGHSYALVADAIESSTDIFSSLVVWVDSGSRRVPPMKSIRMATARPNPLLRPSSHSCSLGRPLASR